MKKVLVATAFLMFSVHSFAQSQDDTRPIHTHRPPPMSDELKSALDDCHLTTGIAKPDFKSGQRPAKEDMEKIKSCMSQKGFNFPPPPPKRDQK